VPRRPPIDPQGYYHVSTRGNFGLPLYQSRGEHELYLELYARHAATFGWSTLEYTLIWNHNHFLIKLTDGGLSEGMRRVNHGFARRLNAAYGRTGKGHVVRHCFFARQLKTANEVRAVARYIALNPVSASQCDDPAAWLWSGFAATIGESRRRPFHDVAAMLAFFGTRPSTARRRYAAFVREPLSPGRVTKASRSERAA
jgi:hypothetical protein